MATLQPPQNGVEFNMQSLIFIIFQYIKALKIKTDVLFRNDT